MSRDHQDRNNRASVQWYWTFTPQSLDMLLESSFGRERVCIKSYGNVFSATCFLWGIAMEEIKREELDWNDPDYPLLLTVRAVRG